LIFSEFFEALIREFEAFVDTVLRAEGPADRLRRELRVLFGRGDLDPAAYFRLLGRLEQGHYIEGELRVLQRQARNRRPELPAGASRAPLDRSLEKVYLNRARLFEARSAMQHALHVLESERAWLERQAQDFYLRAQQALPDETAARGELEIRQACLEQAAGISARLARAQQELRALAALEARLRFAETDLLLLRSREQAAAVELSILKK
jgi:hypothetical protein